jgi:hypothetical protein
MLIAAIRSGSPLAGKAVSYSEDDSKFWLTGVGEVTPARLLEYEQAGELEWADEASRGWVLHKLGGGEQAPPQAPETPLPESAPESEPPDSPAAGAPAAVAEERAAYIAAPLARRGKKAARPDFVEGESTRWRPSEFQWRVAGYTAIALTTIAAVIVMGVWVFGGEAKVADQPTGAAMRLQGWSTGRSEVFDLTSGIHRLSYTVKRTSLGTSSEYTICVVAEGAPPAQETTYAVVEGVIPASYQPGAKSDSVAFDRPAGSYYVKVFSNSCSWTVGVYDR